jgi:hypothetical protein
MRAWPFLLVVALAALPDRPGPRAEGQITVYRCVDAKGALSLQDKPCAKGSDQKTLEMVRPKDAPPRPRAPKPPPEPIAEELPPPEWEYEPLPPPALYQCTSYDGIVRESEQYDPNPRCEPLALYYPYPNELTPEQAGACRWVQDSCVRLTDAEACARYKVNRKKAASEALHADSSMAPYRDSELRRLTQIVNDHCS